MTESFLRWLNCVCASGSITAVSAMFDSGYSQVQVTGTGTPQCSPVLFNHLRTDVATPSRRPCGKTRRSVSTWS